MCGQPIPSPGDLPDLGIQLGSPALQVDSLPVELPGKPNQAIYVKFTDSVILKGEKLKKTKKQTTSISKATQIYPLSLLLSNIGFKVPAMAIEGKNNLNWK